MNIEQQLNKVADHYRSQGFKVTVQPGPEDLPPFAKDFKVEIIAAGEECNVLVSAKGSQLELEDDPNIFRYADITNQQPGWRFDILVLGPENQAKPEKLGAKEPPEEEIERSLNDVDRMIHAGFTRASFLTAWSALEAAMRRRLRAEGEDAGWGTSPRAMLNELYSAGAISTGVLRQLESLSQMRNAIVHGFLPSVMVDAPGVQFLVETARRLLTEEPLAKQPA